jgi:uncharacterized membrane protein
MSIKYGGVSRLLPLLAFATASLATVAEAQSYGPTGDNMMGNGWGWGMGSGMGGFGGIGLLLVVVLVAVFAVFALRRQRA